MAGGGTVESRAADHPTPPQSPGTSPVRLSDCVEEIVRLALAGSLDGPAPDLGLSPDYVSRLLAADPDGTHDPRSPRGLLSHPLYKHLARAIERRIMASGEVWRAPELSSIPVDGSSLALKESEWNKRIADAGLELLNMLEAVEFELHVQEPFFSQLRAGQKTVEGRCATGNYNRFAPGSLLLVNKSLLLKVQHVKWYTSFSEMLEKETLIKVLPGIEAIKEGVQIYRKFYTEEKEMSNGVLAISVSRSASQPSIAVSNLLSELSYDGIGHLLGMVYTVGTVTNALPPPRSSLISSSMQPHRPNIKGCSLTNAARALAKHVNRSSNQWWGSFRGSDSSKNSIASEVINHLLDDCCWLNIHLIQPYECVFEIRVLEGYGARWSKDGSKFIGFLEPYMEEGYSKGWKH